MLSGDAQMSVQVTFARNRHHDGRHLNRLGPRAHDAQNAQRFAGTLPHVCPRPRMFDQPLFTLAFRKGHSVARLKAHLPREWYSPFERTLRTATGASERTKSPYRCAVLTNGVRMFLQRPP